MLLPSIAQAANLQAEDSIRIEGKNRYETAIAASKYAYKDGADTVVLASGEEFADALTGTVLAAKEKGPLLLSKSGEIGKPVLAEIQRLGAKKIIILGGPVALSQKVETQLKDKSLQVERISGANRYETALKVAERLGSTGKKAFLVSGLDFKDALAIGPVAAREGIPILLTRSSQLDPQVKETLGGLGIEEVEIIGGPVAVAKEVAEEIQGMGIETKRLAGDNAIETALAVAEKYFPEPETIFVASNRDFPDGLVGGYLGALLGGPVLLSRPNQSSDQVTNYMKDSKVEVQVLGGKEALSNDVVKDIEKVVEEGKKEEEVPDGGGGGGPIAPTKEKVSAISIKNNDGPNDVLVVGDTLEAVASGQPNITATYKWMRAGDEEGEYLPIDGATAKYYKLTNYDLNNFIKVEVTGTKNYTGAKTSNASAKVKKLDSISIKEQPSKLEYVEGKNLDLSGLEVILNYSDFTKEDVALVDFASRNITTNPEDGSILGVGQNGKVIDISAYGKTVSTNKLTVNAKTLSKIIIKTPPNKMSYVEGQKLDLTGLVVTLEFDNGDKSDITWDDFAINNISANPAHGGPLTVSSHHDKSITISRDGKNVSTNNLNVDAKKVTDIAVISQPNNLDYVEGQQLSLDGLQVALTYNDGDVENVDFDDFSSKNVTIDLTSGISLAVDQHNDQQIVVTCNGKTAKTDSLSVIPKIVTAMTITSLPSKLSYVENENLDLKDLKVNLVYNDGINKDVEPADFDTNGISSDPENGVKLGLEDNGKKIKISHKDLSNSLEVGSLIVAKEKFNITVQKTENGEISTSAFENQASKGEKITITVTSENGEQLLALSIKDSESNDLSKSVELAEIPDKIGQEFTFIMPGKDVTIDATIGESDKNIMYNAGIVGAGEIPLINGNLKDDASKEIDSLTWSYFTNTLTLNGFEGNYLGRANNNATDFDLELKGTNTITDTIRVNPGLKFQGQISIKGDGILKITNSFNSDEEFVRGISFQYSQSIIKLIDTAKVDISLEAKGSGGVAISNVMPFIGNGAIAYKGTAEWDSSHGTDGKPIGISYRVSSSTELKGKNIIVWDASNLVTDIWSVGFGGSSISSEDTIDLSSGEAIVYAKYNDIFYKITIIRDIPIENFSNTSKTDTTASFTWTQAKDATSIKIMQSPKDEDNWTDALIEGGTLEKTSFSATVTGLEADTNYKFKLVVEGGDNRGDSNVVEVTTEAKNPDQIAVDAEVDKYEDTPTIDKEVEAGQDVTETIIKLKEKKTAGDGINLTYFVTPGTYLEVEDNKIKLKKQNFTEDSVTETVTITFTKNGRTATKDVAVTIISSGKKMIIIDDKGDGPLDLSSASLPEGLTWDDDSKVLIMNGYNGGAIYTNFEAGYELKNLVINGENTITVDDVSSTKPVIGFGTKAPLNITGSGTLTITVKSTNSSYTVGIYSGAYYEEGANPNFSGGYNGSTINIDNNTTISIDVESQKGTSYALYAQTLNFNNGTLNIASKSGNAHAYGIQVTDFNYTTGTVKVIDNKEISAGSLSDYSPSFSKETPYVKNSKARKITGLTWDSTNNATKADKAVEYIIYLDSNITELKVEDITALGTLEVYASENFSGSPMDETDEITLNNNEATIYVKAENKGKTRYFKINLVKETP